MNPSMILDHMLQEGSATKLGGAVGSDCGSVHWEQRGEPKGLQRTRRIRQDKKNSSDISEQRCRRG